MKLETIEELNKLTRSYSECRNVLDLINEGRDLSLLVENGVNEWGTNIELYESMESEIKSVINKCYNEHLGFLEKNIKELVNR